jgi:hypothetical protein
MAVFKNIIDGLTPLDDINDRLLANTALKILCGAVQLTLDVDHGKAIVFTTGVGIFDLSHWVHLTDIRPDYYI